MSARPVPRKLDLSRLRRLLGLFPAGAIRGPRQVGKTTLAREFAAGRKGPVRTFDLENPRDRARLRDPMLALEDLRGLVVLDEVQNLPEIFPVLRVLCDRPGPPARFLVLGSAAPSLLRQESESLAGRLGLLELAGFSLDDVGPAALDRLWLRGGFPRSFLARDDGTSFEWRRDFLRLFLGRDLPALGIDLPAETLRRFLSMVAHYHGQTWNGAELARALGVSQPAVRRYLDTLVATFLVRVLPPWSENLSKRQVKSPKVYLADTGLLHLLLGTESRDDLLGHPKAGASWEGFALGEVVRRLAARPEECFFWATHAGAELDLLVVKGNRRLGFEIKRTSMPGVTKSMHVAAGDLRLDELVVVHAGKESFPLGPGFRAVALSGILEELRPLR